MELNFDYFISDNSLAHENFDSIFFAYMDKAYDNNTL